jgi:hypothetical protein
MDYGQNTSIVHGIVLERLAVVPRWPMLRLTGRGTVLDRLL